MTSTSDETPQEDDEEPDSFLCRLGWHSYRSTGRVAMEGETIYKCKRCEKIDL